MNEDQTARPARTRSIALALAVISLAAAAVAAWVFPRAFPLLALEQRVTREGARAAADSFLLAHDLMPTGARRAIRFQGEDSLRTYVELAGGGHDSLAALLRGRDVAPFHWSVRAFVPGSPHEARVDLAPDGRVIGFERRLADADVRPALDPDSSRRVAITVLRDWVREPVERWRPVAASYETKKGSNRVDRTFTFERADRRIAGAPIRLDVVVAGDLPTRARQYVVIPESFQRRYGEMRSSNELLSLIASIGMLALAIAGAVALSGYSRARRVRWREAFAAGGVIGALTLLALLNELPGSWFDYDTALSSTTFMAMHAGGALAGGVGAALLVGLTLAMAEAATRHAFPHHLDWWKLWRYRGTREVAGRVAGGYAAAAVALAYVATFYLVTRTLLGWWVPSEMLDDPNQIASPMPWISGIAMALFAGAWEEALFRALPLALLSLWAGTRARRSWWMAGGVVLSALVFGFAHADYPSWPPYSRGVEIFLDACLWAVLFLRFGLPVTVLAHYAYNLVLFGLFATSGSAPEHRITAAVVLAALLAPAIAVAWKAVRQRGLVDAPPDARFAAWTRAPEAERAAEPAGIVERFVAPRALRLAGAAAALGALVAVAVPRRAPLGPSFGVGRGGAVAVADSVLRARGADPRAWRRLSTTAAESVPGWTRYLHRYGLESQAQRLAASYAPPAWWVVRYVRTSGTAAERAEEWRVRVRPDGRPLDARHVLPESARRDSVSTADARRIARAALAAAGVDTAKLVEVETRERARPARRDVTVTFTDTSVRLAGGAATRAWVDVAGNEPLVARRGVELPESFLRADRESQSRRRLVEGLCALLLVGGMVVGAVLVVRRRKPLLDDGVLDRRTQLLALGALALLVLAEQANSLPATLFRWETSQPWGTFVGTVAFGAVFAVLLALLALGLWLAMTALRRRVGIPMLHAPPSPTTGREVLQAGLGLGALAYAASELRSLVSTRRVPPPPRTLLDDALPWLSDALSLPMQATFAVAAVAIPLLVVAGLTRRWPLRLLAAGVAAVLVGIAASAGAPPGGTSGPAVVAMLAHVALLVAAIRAWGTTSAWVWVVAALANKALDGLRLAAHAPVAQERIAGALTLLAAAALIALVARVARGAPRPPSTERQGALV